MKKIALIVVVALLAGCGAPPPVRIASSVLGRGVLKQARQELQQPTPTPTPQY